MNLLSKTNFLICLDCSKNAWLKIHKPDIYKKYPLSSFELNIIDTGNQIDELARGLFPNGVVIEFRDDTELTKELISEKAAVIYQPVFATDKFITASDIFVWNPNTNLYDLYEVKSSTASDEGGGRKTEEYLIDMAFQKVIFNDLGIQIGTTNLIRLNKEYVRMGDINLQELFFIENLTDQVNEKLEEIKQKMEGAYEYLSKEAEPTGRCDCILKGWNSHCTTSGHSNSDLPEYPVHAIARIHKKKLIKELTKYLLPHLAFQRVDFHNEDSIKCIWKRTDKSGDKEIDIDDLSSGEKSIIILFLPLIESEIHENLKKLETPTTASSSTQNQDLVLIIDEPELHLHPDLQAKILSYIRVLSLKKNVQFIVSTHSPTILDQAYDDELYLLTQKTDAAGTENQLRKIASSIEKLEALKQLTGNAYYITTGRSIICIEGEHASDTKVTDVRLLEILYPRSTAYTFVPSGGKGNVINTVKNLRLHLTEEKFSIAVYGLTDKDQGAPSDVEGVFCLPVCMIENLLLVPESISEYLNTNGISKTPEEVRVILDGITTGLIEQEISLRISKRLKAKTIRVTGKNKEEIKASLESQIEEMRSLIPDDATLDALSGEIKTQVESIVSDNKTLQDFRGKEILTKFYNQEVQISGIPYSKFCYELAQVIAKNQSLDDLLNPVFDQIQNT